MSLQDIKLKNEYRSLADNVPREFYIPLLKEANLYQRAVGFFSSTALAVIASGLYDFVNNGGKIQIIASPKLSEKDIEAIHNGYKNRHEIIEESLLKNLNDVANGGEANRLNLLANLIANEIMDIKIAITKTCGIYHEKLGIISDSQNNSVVFSGSMNETGTAIQENYEAFDVYCSWKEYDRERINSKLEAFYNIWNGLDDYVDVLEFPNIKDEFIEKYKQTDLEEALKKVSYQQVVPNDGFINEKKNPYDEQKIIKPNSVVLYDYQQEAIDKWKDNGYRGIFDMATGTGKTLTGLSAIAELSKNVDRLAVFIVCPYQHLVEQWCEDIRRFNIEPIICYSTSEQKDYKDRVKRDCFSFNFGYKNFICIIATNATFISKFMKKELENLDGEDCLLLVDEAHNFGSKNLSKILGIEFSYRLALSATLERYNDEAGTKKLLNFFGEKCIEYDLERAIQEDKLTKYYYYPIAINLTDEELLKYQDLSAQIAKCIVHKRNGKVELNEKGKRLAVIRARVVAGALNKIPALRKLMIEDGFQYKDNMLVYCGATTLFEQETDEVSIVEDIRQIDYISRMLNFDLEMRTAQFTSNENSEERKHRLQQFSDKEIQALIAIRCLDEGVNVPQIETAFVLASTANPKEYIQRRGRVLRKARGKEYAVIYDFITLPRAVEDVGGMDENESNSDISLVKKELLRLNEFKKLAINGYESDMLIHDIVDAYGLYQFELILNGEVEVDDELWLI
ncbi:MAG: DEAD/DEAH box helicase family protein [Selenomonadaceae bacterium]|nr:DEAD/DEAH box helicase family protein [Selenomonadaceae bacterium]